MIRSRTVRLASVAVLGCAVLAGTAGCGNGPMKAGAAAVIDGQRVSDNDIQSRVTAIHAFGAQHAVEIAKIKAAIVASGSAPAAPSPDVAREQVGQLVTAAEWEKAAQLAGATVTAQNDQDALAAFVTQTQTDAAYAAAKLPADGSMQERIAVVAQAAGVSLGPGDILGIVHNNATRSAVVVALAAKLNVDPTSGAQPGPLQTALQQLVTKAAAEVAAGTSLSPRYGSVASLDQQTGDMSIGSVTPAWVRPATAG